MESVDFRVKTAVLICLVSVLFPVLLRDLAVLLLLKQDNCEQTVNEVSCNDVFTDLSCF